MTTAEPLVREHPLTAPRSEPREAACLLDRLKLRCLLLLVRAAEALTDRGLLRRAQD